MFGKVRTILPADNDQTEATHQEFGEAKTMKSSARNVLKGTIKSVTHGSVNSEIVLELPGGQEIVSIISKSSAEQLGLAKGKEAYAIIKASSVMMGVDE